MTRSFKLTFAAVIGLCATLLSFPSEAVVLGNISVQSALGQPLRATIPFTSTSSDDVIDNTCISLRAPSKSAQSASPYLTKARLTVENINGKQQIVIASTTAINEPAISIQLHITCARDGEFVRDFTVLLDPPEYNQVEAPVTATPLSVAAKRDQTSRIVLGDRYEVQQQDSLDRMARSLFPKSRSKQNRFIQATILANPEAFEEPGSTTVSPGTVLLLPTKASLRISTIPQVLPDAQSQQTAPRLKTEKAPTKRETAKHDQAGFSLKLATGSLDLTPAKNLTEQERDVLRERQLMMASDDQVATMLALKNQVKVLESRLSELQLKLSNRVTETNHLKQEVDNNKAGIAKISSQYNMMSILYWLIGGILTVLLGYAALAWHRNWKSNQTFQFSSEDTFDHDEVTTEIDEALPRRVYVQSSASSDHGMPVNTVNTTQGGDEEDHHYNPNSIFQKDESISLTEFDSVIDEADLYLVYGWTQKAIDLLADHIQRIKTDVPPWMMLADIYRSNNMVQEFAALATEFKTYFENTEWWPKLQAIGKEFDPQNPLFQSQPNNNNVIKEDHVSPPEKHDSLDDDLMLSISETASKEDLPADNKEPVDDMLQFDFTSLREDKSNAHTPDEDDPFSALAPDDHKIMIKRTFSNEKSQSNKNK